MFYEFLVCLSTYVYSFCHLICRYDSQQITWIGKLCLCAKNLWKIKNKNYNKRGRVIGFWNIIIKWWIVFSIYFLRLLYIVWKLHLVRGASHTQNSLMRKTRANIMHIRWHRLLFPYAYAFYIYVLSALNV